LHEEKVRALIAHSNLTHLPEEIVMEMLAHTVPGVLVVASMVAAIALLQTDGHYSYITVQGSNCEGVTCPSLFERSAKRASRFPHSVSAVTTLVARKLRKLRSKLSTALGRAERVYKEPLRCE
jgi:hypothetical protein